MTGIQLIVQVLFWGGVAVHSGSAMANEGIYPAPPQGFAQQPDLMNPESRTIERLRRQAYHFASQTNVPYIWGGTAVGSERECAACRRCVERHKIPVKERFSKCKACQLCGMDCSHLVQSIYELAGLDFPYATVNSFVDHTERHLRRKYDLVIMPLEVAMLQMGDLLVYDKHVVMIWSPDGEGGGEVVHATMMGDKLKLGGIRIEYTKELFTFRGPVRRVLRHRSFFENIKIADHHFDPFLAISGDSSTLFTPGLN